MVRRFVRESAFNIARQDLAIFLEEHEEEMLAIFREELQRLDDEIPEENFFIDIRMVPLGEAIVRSALNAIRRFLTEIPPTQMHDQDEGLAAPDLPEGNISSTIEVEDDI